MSEGEGDDDRIYYFVGQVIPPLDPSQDPRTVEDDQFHHTHSRDIELQGLPVLFDHGLSEEFGDKPLGQIVQSWMAGDGSKKIMGTIDCSTEAGRRAAAMVAQGKIGELSIKHDSFKFNGKRTEIQGRRGIEVSLTEKGDFPNSRIIHKFGTRIFEMDSPAADIPVGTPVQQQQPPAQQQQQQQPPVQQQQQQQNDASSRDFENMSMEELLAEARSTEMSKAEFAEMSAHLARALQNARRSVAELSAQNAELSRTQAESRTQEISKDIQEYIELMQRMGVQVDPQLAELLLGKKGSDAAVLRDIAHTISAHSTNAMKAAQEREAKTAMIEAENAKLKTKVEKYKTASSSSNFRRHLEHLAGRSTAKEMYSQPGGGVQRFAPSAFERAAHDAGFQQPDYLKQAQKNLRAASEAQAQAQASMMAPPPAAQAQQQQQQPPAQQPQVPRFDLSGFASHLQALAGNGM